MINISSDTFSKIAVSIETRSLETSLFDTISENLRLKGQRNTSPITVGNSSSFLALFSVVPFVPPSRRRMVELRICQPFAVNVKFRATRGALIFVKADTKYKPRTCIGFHAAASEAQKLVLRDMYTDGRIHRFEMMLRFTNNYFYLFTVY